MSLAAMFLRPPMRFAGLLQVESRAEVSLPMQKEWEKLLAFEQVAHSHYVVGLDALHFAHSAVARLAFLLNEHDRMHGTSEACCLMKTLVTSLGDTLSVENSHQRAKDCMRESRHNMRSRVHKQLAIISSKVLSQRQTNHIRVPEEEIAQASLSKMPPFVQLTNPNSYKMKREFQDLMQQKSNTHYWPSTSALTQFEEVMALDNLMCHEPTNPPQRCLNCLMEPSAIVASSSLGNAFLVLAKSGSGFVGWCLEKLTGEVEGTNPTFSVIALPSAIQFLHVEELESWVEIPCEPRLKGNHGALVLEQVGEPCSLPLARVCGGLTLTVAEAKAVLAYLGVHLPGQPSKLVVYKALIEKVISSEEKREECLKLANVSENPDTAEDEEFDALLEMVEEDIENRADPDIKNLRKKGRQDQQKTQTQSL